MKKFIAILLLIGGMASGMKAVEPVEGTVYYLPKTELRFRLLVEKTTHTPGEYAIYSERFLKKKAVTTTTEDYRIVGISMYTTAIPDSAKMFVMPMDKKHTIFTVDRDNNGVLLAINAKGKTTKVPQGFTAGPKAKQINPHDFMSADILAAGSTAKMAELTAREIYDIRDSRNELSRGEADYMPKDGEQLKIMLANLDRQEKILLQTFQGTIEKDTTEHELVFCPDSDGKTLFFRFSKKLGLVDKDDLGGSPYYINIEDLQVIPEVTTEAPNEKRAKEDPGIMLNMPGKIKITLLDGNNPVQAFECYAAQFGRLESLSSALFGKKTTSRIVLNPITGNIENMEIEPLD